MKRTIVQAYHIHDCPVSLRSSSPTLYGLVIIDIFGHVLHRAGSDHYCSFVCSVERLDVKG